MAKRHSASFGKGSSWAAETKVRHLMAMDLSVHNPLWATWDEGRHAGPEDSCPHRGFCRPSLCSSVAECKENLKLTPNTCGAAAIMLGRSQP